MLQIRGFLKIFILFVILVRLSLLALPSFKIDMTVWQAWTARIIEVGPVNFYSPGYFADYPPIYLYLLGLMGLLFNLFQKGQSLFSLPFEIYFKSLMTLFDLLTAYIIYRIFKDSNQTKAYAAALLYLLNPVNIFIASVWGQNDPVMVFFLCLSIYFLMFVQKPLVWALFFAIAVLVKFQALIALPVMAIYLFKKYRFRQFVYSLTVLAGLALTVSLPFFIKNDPLLGLLHLFQKSSNVYPYLSLFAFNFWSLVGFWQPDNQLWFSMPYVLIGAIVFILSLVFIAFKLFREHQPDTKSYIMALALSYMSFFLLPTRVHERYLYPFFALFLLAAFLYKSLRLKILYAVIALLNFLNIWYVYFYYNVIYNNPGYTGSFLFDYISSQYRWLSIITLLLYVFLIKYYYSKESS
ncbi:glycosyltransferase family 39 protein [Candidatus Daviesbacteria bacterium]|nr:glycosyltransferase family 39 protein [Candidatus Daviesbacteria bacterium]